VSGDELWSQDFSLKAGRMTSCDQYEPDTTHELHADVETYHQGGMWYTRRCDSTEPFASGASRLRLIAIGVEVARWNGLRHLIRDTDGTIAEINTYLTGPYPARSPIKHQRIRT
jgi:hypothetical protein